MPISARRPSSLSLTIPAWMRWMPVWHGLFYVTLILAAVVALTDGLQTWPSTGILFCLSMVSGLWYGVCVVISPLFWRKYPLLTMGYLATGWVLWYGLVERDPVYLFVLTGLYPQVFALAPSPGKIAGAWVLTAIAAWRQATFTGIFSVNVYITLFAGVMSIVMALFINAIVEQSQRQQRLIVELEETRQALATAERQAGIMDERQRLAREIHDTLAQGFSSIVMQLEGAEAAFPAEFRTLQSYLEQAQRTARENLAESRRLMWALQPTAFDHASLAEIVTHFANSWSLESGIAISTIVTGIPQSLRPEIEVTLLRAAQETLANARKYAQASQLVLTLSYMDDMVILDVQDNGVGFDPTYLSASIVGQRPGGFGLKALRTRIEQLGGTLSIESRQGEGTTIAVALPAVSNESQFALDAAKAVGK